MGSVCDCTVLANGPVVYSCGSIIMNEDGDEVVQEIPVYISQTLAKQLYIFQYPTRPSVSSCPEPNVVKSSIKPSLQEIELQLSIDTSSSNYDKGRGEQIALNADGVSGSSKSGGDLYFPSGKMDHMTLKSSRLLTDSHNYAVGILNEGEFHITPLKGIVSLRPTFSYLDKSDRRQTNIQEDHSGGEEEEEMKQVKVKFARVESERAKKAREQSYDFHNKKSSCEPWYQTEFITSQSDEAEQERNKLFCPQLSDLVSELNLSGEEYLKHLINSETSDESTSGAIKRCLKSVNQADQIRTVMKEAHILQFRHLISVLPGPVDLQAALRSVQNVAVLVRGNWIVRSDIIYPKDSFSAMNGISAEIMCRSRDYVLYQLTQHKYLDRISTAKVVKLPTAELLEILNGIAALKRCKGWELKLAVDRDFIERYPDVVQRQEMWWDAKQRQLNEAFRSKPQTPPTSPVKQRGARSGSRRRDSSFSSDGEGRATSGRQRKKSVSQSVPGVETESQLSNGASNSVHSPQKKSRKKSMSLSNDSDSGSESRHLNNNSEYVNSVHKRMKKYSIDDS